MEPTKGAYIPQIDAIRALAFLLVVLVHFSVPTWNAAISSNGSIFKEIVESQIKNGWFGVSLFLFVSGYSLALGKTSEGAVLNLKNFYINRILRIYPLYLFCISILAFTHSLPGQMLLTLGLLQTQDIPKNSPFPVLWSIQLEVGCYLLFPVFLEAVRRREALLYIFSALALIRVGMLFLPTASNWELSYSTVFGGATLFLSGMFAASLSFRSKILFPLGLFLFLIFSLMISRYGGFSGGRD